MATKTLASRIKMKRDTSANWNTNNPILLNGEIIIVDTEAGETRYKIGDGVKTYSQLPFQDEYIRNLIANKLDKTATAADSSKLNGQNASYYAVDSNVVHKDGTETITGAKTFNSNINGAAGATIKSVGNAILNIKTVTTNTDYAHIYVTGTGNTNRPLVLNTSSDGSGPVGIGVAQPTEKLEVNGNIKATKYIGAAELTGAPTAPTAAAGTNNTQIATTAFVKTALSSVGGVDVSLNANQPSGQSTGDFWYQITTA